MLVAEPTRHDLKDVKKSKKYSKTIRLWHWANALVIMGSLITVLINSTLFEDESIRSQPQWKSIFHTLEDKVWGVHIYFGYALAGLFVFRVVLELFQLPGQKFMGKMKLAYQDYFAVNQKMELARHELIVKILYVIFYMLLAIMVLTGLTLAFEDQLPIPRQIIHSVKDFHGFCMYLIIAFIVVHIAGVFLAERKGSKGIVSDMINGGGRDA